MGEEFITVYEAGPSRLLTVEFVVICVFLVLTVCYTAFTWKKDKISGNAVKCFIAVFLSTIIIITVVSFVKTQELYKQYENKEYNVVEGTIENYTTNITERGMFPDTFSVNGIEFEVSKDPSTGYGYPVQMADGGLLYDGLWCRIVYIPFRYENVIFKVELYLEDVQGHK